MNEVAKSTKTKTTAVVLAVLLSLWSWLYTYKKNKIKFWTGIAVSLFLTVIYMVTYDLVISALIIPLMWVWGIALWIWAIVDNATKHDMFYINYPS